MKERIQKILSARGVASRRQAENLIKSGKITCNGEVCQLGDQSDADIDVILVDGAPLPSQNKYVYLMLHKPKGVVTTLSDEKGRRNVADLVADCGCRVYPVGRLDKDSEGLILLTNQGELVDRILRGSNYHEKEYIVTVNKKITPEFIRAMGQGVPILDVVTRPCQIEAIGNRTFRIILTQGLNRQIRRMCEYFDYRVIELQRVRVMNIRLGRLKLGTYRRIVGTELEELMKLL